MPRGARPPILGGGPGGAEASRVRGQGQSKRGASRARCPGTTGPGRAASFAKSLCRKPRNDFASPVPALIQPWPGDGTGCPETPNYPPGRVHAPQLTTQSDEPLPGTRGRMSGRGSAQPGAGAVQNDPCRRKATGRPAGARIVRVAGKCQEAGEPEEKRTAKVGNGEDGEPEAERTAKAARKESGEPEAQHTAKVGKGEADEPEAQHTAKAWRRKAGGT